MVNHRAVLFDLDGTLLDSAPYWQAAWRDLVTRRATPLPDGALDGLAGLSTPDAVATVHERLSWSGDVPADVAWLEERVGAAFRRQTVWLPGALRLVAEVRAAGRATGLVTSSSRLLVDSVLPDDRRDLFDVVVTGDDVERLKPAPDPYELAARWLGLRPADCVAIEDSAPGVASAAAAGCTIVHLGHTGPSCCPATVPAPDLDRLSLRMILADS